MLAINTALAHGDLDRQTPWIKRNAMQALTPTYTSTAAAHDSIALFLRSEYGAMRPDSLAALTATIQEIHDRILFPEMRVRWEAYPDHNGHMISAGCFRCHGSDLQTAAGKRISNDCNLCHTIVAQGPPGDPQAGLQWTEDTGDQILGLDFRHPLGIDKSEKTLKCWECHRGGAEVYLPRQLIP
jgi:hypothetical protein